MGVIRSIRKASTGVRSFKDAAFARTKLRTAPRALGGMARFEAEKAQKPPLGGRSLLARIVVIIMVVTASAVAFYSPSVIAAMISGTVNAILDLITFTIQALTPADLGIDFQFRFPQPLATPIALVLGFFAMQVVSRSTARQLGQRSSGSLDHYWRKLGRLSPVLLVAIFGIVAVLFQLLGEGLPASFGGGFLSLVAQWFFGLSLIAGFVVALFEGKDLAKSNQYEEEQMRIWVSKDGFFHATLGRWVDTPDFHDAVQFEGDSVRLHPVPITLTKKFPDIEITMAHVEAMDSWMLDPASTATDLLWVPITDEQLERRKMLRASDYTLIEKHEIGLEDKEILGHSLVLPDGAIDPESSSPSKPVAALVADHVTEKQLPQIQRFASDSGMTVVAYDFERFNSEDQRYENLVYLQEVDEAWAQTIKRGADLLGIKPGTLWMEPHWIVNDEDDRDKHPSRIDTVVIKRSPVSGLTPEAREKYYLALIGTMPKGNNGWTIEDDQSTGMVALTYGKPLSLPPMFSTLDTLPEVTGRDQWNWCPLGIDGRGEIVWRNLLDVPHGGVSGLTGSGKSTALRHDIVSRILRDQLVFVFDPAKLGNDFLPLRPWLTGFSNSYTETANTLEIISQEFKRRRSVGMSLGKTEIEELTPQELAENHIQAISVFFDEWQSAVRPVEIPDINKDSTRYIEAVARKASVGQIKSLMDDLVVLGRAWGIHLELATQVLSVENVGKVLRPNLGASVQLKAPGSKLESYIIRMSMGEGATTAIEEFELYEKTSGGRGIAVTGSDGGTPIGYRGAFISTDDAVTLLRDRLPELRPWAVHDVLEIGLEPSLVGKPDDRAPIEAPVFALASASPAPPTPALPESKSRLAQLFGS